MQSQALKLLAEHIPADFEKLTEHVLQLKGRVITCGVGKSGYIAQKIAASLASTGTPSFFIHPTEASHGDLGMIVDGDMIMILSNSGETKEIFDIINYCKTMDIKIIGVTMNNKSTLALNSNFVLTLPKISEINQNIAAPTNSALMALSIGDALVSVLMERRNFTKEQFKILHPGGQIGTNLLKVQDVMHQKEDLPLLNEEASFAEVILVVSQKRLGCAIIVDSNNHLQGIITDGDIRRHVNSDFSTLSAREVMTYSANVISQDMLASKALSIMNEKSITVLPVIEDDQVIGLVHIHDILKRGIGE
ncbi:MAG: KpsF/GutQ family sugar-phosphate isomerase [Rickettsiaceae bacterium]|nr:KpsF/GutQ family sugar-phosphate isomerase [Rickettsiaceae bacterium]